MRRVQILLVFCGSLVCGCEQETSSPAVSTPEFQEPDKAVSETVVTPSPRSKNKPGIPQPSTPAPSRIPLVAERPVRQPVEALRPWMILVPEKQFATHPETGALLLDYHDLDLKTVLNMQTIPPNAVDYFPVWLNELDGKQVRIRGFMRPHWKEDGIRIFAFFHEAEIILFVRKPRPDQLMTVLMKDGTTTRYQGGRPIEVERTFLIKPWVKKGEVKELFRIHDARVIELGR